jgi:hypothetical protein
MDANRESAGVFANECDLLRIAAKVCDIIDDPLQCQRLIPEPDIT